MTRKLIEGSRAVAEAVALCRPQVISAYPITPQTHIVAELADMVAEGHLRAEFVNVESEHSAASLVLGASATGVRVYTASTSQGILLMNEVLYNIAGMRLPVVMTCANRAISAPINIWNDQQDSISVRDTGMMQFYAENNQEAMDLHYFAYRLAEDHRVLLPAMVCMDGFILTHAYESVEVPTQAQVDVFLPPYQPLYVLDPADPITMGTLAEPDKYLETRYMVNAALEKTLDLIPTFAGEFAAVFGRRGGGLVEGYRLQDAETVIVGMGSVMSTLRETVAAARERGQRVGALKVITYRPFPKAAVARALGRAKRVLVLDKAISMGSGGPLATEVKAALYGRRGAPRVAGLIAGLGGREITVESLERLLALAEKENPDGRFLDLRTDVEMEIYA
ncbi:MAG: pyruvate ferredoxin oxidoreductase [Chloroflexi bacterium]|nr:pyruvate ferredoxin oxidoreductase [Chloroflexota bacterium]